MLMPTVARYMTPDPWSVAPRDTLSHAHQLMADHHVRHLPVLEEGVLVGILSDRDLLSHVGERVADAMSYPVLSVTKDAPLDEVIALMQSRRCSSVMVSDRSGVHGIFTLADAMRAFDDMLRRTIEGEP